ncbi:MAG TPA: DUF3347 domain-containing protein [Chitinophagales bacterium]|nr:DUF3347 domain-containing protein [Chitinophagales bacterium]HNC34866.1 DUF3347 domain-containing protein [Bacteroidia bacterium]HMX03360.1 DUF3347 domain-containing protein [Chitinophagales bacterium]HMZ89029.1 DUF3347 domain-containing protein [Chitinophagales bacterium]HNA56720.1 DUF3347 domain-containing protein [Chitinophagales bacterium]
MKSFILFSLIAIIHSISIAQGVSAGQILNRYMVVKEALSEGNYVQANQAGALLKAALFVYDDSSETEKTAFLENVSEMYKYASKISSSSDLNEIRNAFAKLTPAVWNFVSSSPAFNLNYNYLYCTMQKAYWIDYDSSVINPYVDKSMQECGVIRNLNVLQ